MGTPVARQFTGLLPLLVGADVAGEDLGGDGHVVVAVVDSLDFLIPLSALARNDDGVAGLGRQDGAAHGVASARRNLGDVLHAGAHRGDATQQIVTDRLRILGARVLVRDPQDVGLARRDLRQMLTLGRIAIAVGAKDDDDFAGGQLAR